ncbi:hypothetical protein [Patulibacter defluvii]|uniref:hypothetical protein n=1 Tax=Patulibacter defluvii TaxID=3095358 RepID=UPI002A75A4D2|nr:hypothetical protein [Patulibacter sp. DM4]
MRRARFLLVAAALALPAAVAGCGDDGGTASGPAPLTTTTSTTGSTTTTTAERPRRRVVTPAGPARLRDGAVRGRGFRFRVDAGVENSTTRFRRVIAPPQKLLVGLARSSGDVGLIGVSTKPIGDLVDIGDRESMRTEAVEGLRGLGGKRVKGLADGRLGGLRAYRAEATGRFEGLKVLVLRYLVARGDKLLTIDGLVPSRSRSAAESLLRTVVRSWRWTDRR